MPPRAARQAPRDQALVDLLRQQKVRGPKKRTISNTKIGFKTPFLPLRGNRFMKPVFRSKNGLVFGPQFRVRCIEFASRTSAPRTPFGHASNHLRVMIAQLLHPASPPYQAHPCGEIVPTAVSSNMNNISIS